MCLLSHPTKPHENFWVSEKFELRNLKKSHSSMGSLSKFLNSLSSIAGKGNRKRSHEENEKFDESSSAVRSNLFVKLSFSIGFNAF